MTRLLIFLSLIAGVCVGQQTTSPATHAELLNYSKEDLVQIIFNFRRALGMPLPADANQIPASKPAPLKCGKYEHVDYPFSGCADVLGPYNGEYHNQCYPPRCAPDLHTLREDEWQETQQKIKELMGRLKQTDAEVKQLIDALKAQQDFDQNVAGRMMGQLRGYTYVPNITLPKPSAQAGSKVGRDK